MDSSTGAGISPGTLDWGSLDGPEVASHLATAVGGSETIQRSARRFVCLNGGWSEPQLDRVLETGSPGSGGYDLALSLYGAFYTRLFDEARKQIAGGAFVPQAVSAAQPADAEA